MELKDKILAAVYITFLSVLFVSLVTASVLSL